MADNASRDQNRVTTLLGVDSVLFRDSITIAANSTTHAMLVEGTFTPSGTTDVNLIKVGGTSISLGQTTMSASLPVTIASNQSALPVSQSGTWNINNISGTISLPTGAATLAEQQTQTTALGTLLTTSAFQARINTLGQKSMANSTPVVLASDQSAIPVTLTSTTITGTVAVTQSTTPWVIGDSTNSVEVLASGADAVLNTTNEMVVGAFNYGFNGTSWDRLKSVNTGQLRVTTYDSSGNSDANTAWPYNADGLASFTLYGRGTISSPLIFNGTNHDRQRSIITGTNSTGTGIQAVGLIAQFDDTSPTSITENQFGNLRISANRNLYSTIRDAGGSERGANVDANNNLGVVLAAETTKVIGTVNQGTSPWVVSLSSTTITGTVAVTQSTSPWIVAGGGTAGTAASGVVTVQGIASMTPVQVSQATASNLNATVVQGTATNLKTQAENYQGGAAVSSSNPLEVNLRSSTITLNVSAAQSGTWTVQPGNTANTTPWLVSTKTALTASSPTAATVGVTSAQAVASNSSRKGLTLINTSANKISLGFGAAAVLNSGITLFPGGVFVMDQFTFNTGAVNAIAGGASSNLAIQEFS